MVDDCNNNRIRNNKHILNDRSDSKAFDAANRHIRRHPKNYKEVAELFESYDPKYIEL